MSACPDLENDLKCKIPNTSTSKNKVLRAATTKQHLPVFMHNIVYNYNGNAQVEMFSNLYTHSSFPSGNFQACIIPSQKSDPKRDEV